MAFVGWSIVLAGGCAAVTGLDSISEQDCAPLCGDAQAGKDVTVDVPSSDDSTSPETSPGMDTGMVEAAQDTSTPPTDAKGDTSTKEAGADAPVEAANDGPIAPEGSSPDAPFDSGCGALNTADNCSACGDKCASTTTVEISTACNGDSNGFGSTCSYTCANGYQDCNAANAPNLDGCECHVVGRDPGAMLPRDGHVSDHAQQRPEPGQLTVLRLRHLRVGRRNRWRRTRASHTSALRTRASARTYTEADGCTPDSWCSGAFTGDCVCWTYSGQYAGTVFDAKAQGASPPCSCSTARARPCSTDLKRGAAAWVGHFRGAWTGSTPTPVHHRAWRRMIMWAIRRPPLPEGRQTR